jgi:hypothetical protein
MDSRGEISWCFSCLSNHDFLPMTLAKYKKAQKEVKSFFFMDNNNINQMMLYKSNDELFYARGMVCHG